MGIRQGYHHGMAHSMGWRNKGSGFWSQVVLLRSYRTDGTMEFDRILLMDMIDSFRNGGKSFRYYYLHFPKTDLLSTAVSEAWRLSSPEIGCIWFFV
jgi:hypothetical protein